MTKLVWDAAGAHRIENGVDHGVLYIPNSTTGVYDKGVVWNGLTTVTEKPSGAESTSTYADNIEYAKLTSAEKFGATIEALTYPNEFAECDGTVEAKSGVFVGQQPRKPFGLVYRTKIGTDANPEAGYKLHLVYNATAAPSEKAYATINDSPEAITFSWEMTTIPVAVTGHKPTSILTIDSTKVAPADLTALEDALFGDATTGVAHLPTPDEVIAMFTTAP